MLTLSPVVTLARRAVGVPVKHSKRPRLLLYLIGQGVSTLGDRVTLVALPSLLLGMGGGASELARLAFTTSAAQLLFVLAAGVLVDRLPKRAVMMTADGVRILCLTVAAGMLWTERLDLTALLVVAAVMGLSAAAFLPAATALMPEIVAPDMLVSANSLRTAGNQAAGMAGPGLGGILLAVAHGSAALLFDASTFLVSMVSLGLLGRTGTGKPRAAEGAPKPKPPSLFADFVLGLRVAGERTWLWLTILFSGILNLFAGGFLAILVPLHAREVFGTGRPLGWLFSAEGAGALAAALALRVVQRVPRRGIALYLAIALSGVPVVLLPFAHSFPMSLVLVFVFGACVVAVNILWESALQEYVPLESLGRVAALDLLGSLALLPLGQLATGLLVTHFGRGPTSLYLGGSVMLLSAMGLSVRSIRALR